MNAGPAADWLCAGRFPFKATGASGMIEDLTACFDGLVDPRVTGLVANWA